MVVVPSDRCALRKLDEFVVVCWSNPDHKPPLVDTSLLRVSKRVYEEVAPIFYAQNHFHYLIETHGLDMFYEMYTQNQRFSKRCFLKYGAEFVRHIGLEVTIGFDASDPRVYRDEVERILPKYLEVIAQSCRQLRYLEIHFISAPPSVQKTDKAIAVPGSWQVAKKQRAAWQVDNIPKQIWEGATPLAVERIMAQTRLSRLTVSATASNESENVFTGICLPIAPREQWTVSDRSWVGFPTILHGRIEIFLKWLRSPEEYSVQQWCWEPTAAIETRPRGRRALLEVELETQIRRVELSKRALGRLRISRHQF